MNHFFHIADYIFENFIHTWPYLLITIPIVVGVNMIGCVPLALVLLFPAGAGLNKMRCQKYSSGHGAHAFEEFALSEQ